MLDKTNEQNKYTLHHHTDNTRNKIEHTERTPLTKSNKRMSRQLTLQLTSEAPLPQFFEMDKFSNCKKCECNQNLKF